MDHYGGAESGFVGKNTSGNSGSRGKRDAVSEEATRGRPKAERFPEDHAECAGDGGCVAQYDDQAACHIEHGHKRHDFFRNACDPLDAADDDKSDEDHQYGCCQNRRDMKGIL